MGQEPAYIKNLRALMKGEPTIEHLEALESELYASGSDRATAVMLASFLEDHLGRLLKSAMRHPLSLTESNDIFEHRGPLASFDSRIIMAYALNLIGPKTRSDLKLIKSLRNAFAHSRMPFGFQAPEVRAVCNKLQIIDLPGTNIPYRYLERVPHEELKSATDKTDPKTRFIGTCHNISYRMNVKRDGPREGDQVFPNDDPLP